jgi:hypothetical protein
MKLTPLGPNTTELDLADGSTVMFSYKTPVAAYVMGRGFIQSEQHYSATTTRHLRKWLDGRDAETVPQTELDRLVGAL